MKLRRSISEIGLVPAHEDNRLGKTSLAQLSRQLQVNRVFDLSFMRRSLSIHDPRQGTLDAEIVRFEDHRSTHQALREVDQTLNQRQGGEISDRAIRSRACRQ